MTHLLLHKTPNSVSSEPGAAHVMHYPSLKIFRRCKKADCMPLLKQIFQIQQFLSTFSNFNVFRGDWMIFVEKVDQ
jgi:hypothetical protein